jgi:predicted aspartyl protease
MTEIPAEGATLPTHRCSNAFLVEATINGRGPYTLLIDTGAGVTALSPAVAEQLSEGKGWTFARVTGATGKTVSVSSRIHIDTLEAGGMRLGDFDALVMDTDGFEVIMGGKFDGILGYPSFRNATLILDYPHQEVRVSSRPFVAEAAAGASVLPITGRDVPRIGFKLGERYVGAILDSGSGGELALAPGSADIVFETKPVPAGSTLALGGHQVRMLGRAAADIEFAGVTLRRPLIETDAALNLLGAEVMRNFRVTIDAREGVVEFFRESREPIEFPPLYGVGLGAAPIEGKLVITDVFAGSAAERAGILVGDELLEADGRSITSIICERSRLFEHTGPAVLTVRRNGAEMRVTVDVGVMVP